MNAFGLRRTDMASGTVQIAGSRLPIDGPERTPGPGDVVVYTVGVRSERGTNKQNHAA